MTGSKEDQQVGISVVRTGTYFFLRITLSKRMLTRFGFGPNRRLNIRGQPANGFILTAAGKGLKPRPVNPTNPDILYISTTISHFELSRRSRRIVNVRAEFEGAALRIAPLPQAWIDGSEFEAPPPVEPSPPLGNGMHHHNGNGGDGTVHRLPANPITAPLPKAPPPVYRVPAHVDIGQLQNDLTRKLDEARAILRDIESKTGLKFVLDRNLRVVLSVPSTN